MRKGGAEGFLWKACNRRELRLPAPWEKIRFRKTPTVKAWFNSLRRGRVHPMHDLCFLDSRVPQSVRLYGVSADVYARMETLANAGAIEPTSLEQRRRHGRTPKTEYGVPRWLQEVLTYSYISPNLPSPKGFEWKN